MKKDKEENKIKGNNSLSDAAGGLVPGFAAPLGPYDRALTRPSSPGRTHTKGEPN